MFFLIRSSDSVCPSFVLVTGLMMIRFKKYVTLGLVEEPVQIINKPVWSIQTRSDMIELLRYLSTVHVFNYLFSSHCPNSCRAPALFSCVEEGPG